MKTTKKLTAGLLLIFWAAAFASAQDRTDAGQSAPASTVTISASEHGVRYAAFGGVRQMRLEVFGASGESLYNSGFRAGSVSDWALEDGRRQRLPDGAYLCVVTVRELSGGLSVKQGSVVIQGAQVSLQLGEAAQASSAETDKGLTPVSDGPAAVTLTAHDGSDGQVVSTHGSLTFRAGDFFAGRDREFMRLTPEGRVGIGTSDPQAALDVAGTIRAQGGIRFEDGSVLNSAGRIQRGVAGTVFGVAEGNAISPSVAGTGTTNQLTKWTDNAGTLGDSTVTEVGGNVGIGTSSPTGRLHVVDPVGSIQSGDNAFRVETTGGTIGPSFRFKSFQGADYLMTATGSGNAGGAGAFRIYDLAGDTTRLYIAAGTGNIGIGTATPAQKLDVVGNLKVSGNADVAGNIAAKYQDVAEWVEADRRMNAGTVVVLDAARTNAVKHSFRAYDTHVAGVVSAQPGIILGEGGEGKVLVATTGRVKVRVDATRRPVRIGDLLVTSNRPGVAMRSVPVRAGRALIHRPGTIIGKALEPLAGGEGEILVLLSLQ